MIQPGAVVDAFVYGRLCLTTLCIRPRRFTAMRRRNHDRQDRTMGSELNSHLHRRDHCIGIRSAWVDDVLQVRLDTEPGCYLRTVKRFD